MRKLSLLAIAWVILMPAIAQDSLKSLTLQEVVVTGTKYDVPVEKSNKSITRITAEELEAFSGGQLADVLNTVPNLQIDGVYGSPGTNIGYYARGARNRQTVILIDGIPMTDASGISPEFDLRLLPLDQVESIEVLRGGLSTLYGSGAAAAVINIKLKEVDSGTHGAIGLNAGSFKTFKQNLSLSTAGDKFYALVNGSNMSSQGFSSAKDPAGTDTFDRDGLDRKNLLLRLGLKTDEQFDVQLMGAWDKFSAEYDDGPFADAMNVQNSEQFRMGIKGSLNQKWGTLKLLAQQTWLDKEFDSSFPDSYKSNVSNVEVSQNWRISEMATLLSGVSYQRLSYSQEFVDGDTVKFSITDPYTSLVLDFPFRLTLQGGLRLNHHSEYGNKFVYDGGAAYRIELSELSILKLHGSVSTSYVTPSLYQLFSYFGNKDLSPEETLNWEFGSTLYKDKMSLSVVYFNRKETQLIGFQSFFDDMGNFVGGSYYNMPGDREVYGVEAEFSLMLTEQLLLKGMYSNANTSNAATFYRIPAHKASASAGYSWNSGNVTLRYDYTGSRKDINFATFEEVSMGAFHLAGVSVSQAFMKDKLKGFVSCNNLLDADYQWAPGYNSVKRNLRIGLRYEF